MVSSPPAFSADVTVHAMLRAHGRATPDKMAVICGDASLTYLELADRTARCAAGMLGLGIAPGARVAVETDNTLEHLIGVLAALAVGAVAVALPRDIVSYAAILADCEAALVISTADDETRLARAGHGGGAKIRTMVELLAAAPVADLGLLGRRPEAEDLAMLYYTSGTTSGVRKGVMQSYRQLHATAHYISAVMRMDDTIVEYVATSTDNCFWFGRCRCIIHVGGTMVLSERRLNPLTIIGALERFGGNALSGDTPIFMQLLHYVSNHLARVGPRLKWVKIASAPMPLADKTRIIEMMPNAWFVFNYGLTEAMRTCLNAWRLNPGKLDSVGPASPGVEVTVLGPDDRPVPTGEVGEVAIRGGNLASGYWRKDAFWAEKMRGGWYHTGDLGHLDGDGFLFLKGRADHAINSGGRTIALSEVEERVRPFLDGATFAVCGMNDPRGVLGDVVALCVEGSWSLPKAWPELRVAMLAAVEPLHVPTAAFIVPSLPRTANQKVQVGKLRELIEADGVTRL